jgi:hypothetical protein
MIVLGIGTACVVRSSTPFGHELFELCLVLGMAKTVQERLEFSLFLFQPAKGFFTIFVER